MKQTLCLLPVLAACAALAAPEYRNLPPAYVQVEYIRSTGAQYIDTGIAAGPDVSAVLDFIPLEYTGNVSLGTQPGDDNRD